MKTIFKCVTSFLLIFSVIMSNFLHIDVTAENTNAVTLINIPLCSNIIQDESTTLYEINDSYYMTLAQIVQLTGFEIALGKDTNNGDLHIFDFDDSFDVIGKGYNTVTFIDGIREVKINLESEYLYESGEHYAIRIEKYENQYLLEAIPLLKYLLGVDSCDMIDGVFRCEAPYETIWKALSDAFELSKAVCYDYSYFYEEYEKRIFFDISYQCFMDLRIPKIEEYYRKTIHDILSDNIYEYDGVQTISNEQDEYHSLDDLLDVVDVSKDVINNSASRITEQYINHQLQNLNTEWLETSDARKSAELSKQINIKINELVNSKNYFDKMDSGLKAIMYGANIANAFAKNYAYNYDTATLLDDAIDKDLLSNINTENWYWLDEANRINSSIKSNWSNIGNSVLDSTVKLFEDEGNDLLICSIAENASSYLLIVKAELMVGKLIFKDNYEKVDKDILSGFESDLQAQYKQLCNVLYLKARNELYTSEKTIDQMLAAFKFYYKLSAVYLKNVSIQFEQNNWMEDYADDAAKMYYRLLTCFKTPNSGFEKLEDDVFSQEAISQIKVVDYEKIYYSYIENELVPKYGLASLNQFEIDQNENNGMPNTSFGIVSADIDDYDNDNSKELIVLALEPSEQEKFYCDINLHLYSIEDDKVKYTDSEYLYGYQMYDIHSDNFFTLDKCNNNFLFANNVCYFSGEAASSNVTIIKIVNSNFVSENMTTSDYEGEKLYVNGNEVYNSNGDVNFYEMTQRIISQKLRENGFSFDNVEYKGRSINVSVTNNTKIAKYSATFDSSSANWFSVISPNDFTNLRDQISQTLFGSTTSWQQLYADELRKYINSDNYYTDTMFELMDIDNNNVPELFISEMSAHVGQVLVYTIHNGKLIFLGDYGEYGYVSYNSEKSLMWSGYFNHGRGFESHYRLENGTLVEVFSCETNSAAIVDESEVYYMINGENVSKSEFETKREENTFDGWVEVGRKHSLDESTINSVLLSSGTRMGIIITENDALNVRQSPSTESTKIGTVDKGSTVIIRSEVDGWYEIEFNGNSGYVSGEYVQIVE